MLEEKRERSSRMEGTANSSLHHNVEDVETFPKISGNTGDMPVKMESNAFIGGAVKFETKSSSDSIQVSDQAMDLNPTIVRRIRVSETTGEVHSVADMGVMEH
jgi:hypothetical protein